MKLKPILHHGRSTRNHALIGLVSLAALQGVHPSAQAASKWDDNDFIVGNFIGATVLYENFNVKSDLVNFDIAAISGLCCWTGSRTVNWPSDWARAAKVSGRYGIAIRVNKSEAMARVPGTTWIL